MRLGFDDRILSNKHFQPIALNDNTVGFNLGVYLNYYRGVAISCIDKLELSVNGKSVPEHFICVVINEKKFTVAQLKDLYSEFWGIRNKIDLEVYNGGLPPGEHDIELTLELRNPYMRFAPRVYGMFDSSAHKTMTLAQEVKTL
ncbi:hypothetical protein GCM10027217_15240 [Pseudomaricurvus hydrocarbonicus]